MQQDYDATYVADLYFKEGVKLHGFPRFIVSNRYTKYLSHFSMTLRKNLGTKLKYSNTCHPQMDGQTEFFKRTLGVLLKTLVKFNIKLSDQLLAHAQFAYNKAPSKTTGMSPFNVIYGVEPLSPLDLTLWPMEIKPNVEASKRFQDIQELH